MWASMLDVHVAGVTEDECFSSARSHNLNPLWLLSTGILFQVFERPDVMHLYLSRHAGCPALFTSLGQDPSFQFRPFPGVLLHFVLNGCGDIPGEGDASPSGYQWFLSLSRDRDLESLVFFPIDIQFRSIFFVYFANGHLVFKRQRLC